MKLLDHWKVINEEVHRKVMVFQEEIPDYTLKHREPLEQFFESVAGEFVRKRAEYIEIIEQHDPVLALTNQGVVCYLKEKDITYLTLTQS